MKHTSRIFRSRLAVAITAMMLTAVVVAGGLAGALPGRNTVQGNDIRTNAVKARHIKADAVRSSEIQDFSITADDVAGNTLTGAEIDESTLGSVPSADSLNGAGIALINHRSGNTGPTPIAELNDLTILVSCTGSTETITATTSASGDNEISSISNDASSVTTVFGAFDDTFSSGETFQAGPGTGNAASERQYLITYSAADGRNVTATFVTEDTVGGSNCAVSGYAIG